MPTTVLQDPGKVWKGKKMAGHMGDENVTARSMQVTSGVCERCLLAHMS